MEVRAFDVDKLVNRLEEAELYTNKFGTFAKSDFELLMFTIYLDMLTEEPKDYEISVALGSKGYGQCDTGAWTDIVAVAAGYQHTVGLKSDGTVVAVGDNNSGRCDIDDWKLWD